MDLLKAIRELEEERKRLNKAIAALEAAAVGSPAQEPALPKLRAGRKSMSGEERRMVSERMVRYWMARRAAKAAAALPEGVSPEPTS